MKARIFECGGCDCYHPFGWSGDCRDDSKRYGDPREYAQRNGISEDNILIVDEETGEET